MVTRTNLLILATILKYQDKIFRFLRWKEWDYGTDHRL